MNCSSSIARVLLPLMLLSAGGMLGCGPTQSAALIRDAQVRLEAAKIAEAAKLAPFEYTAAESYLAKAKEEQGYSDYEVCIDFAQKAVRYATEAKNKALAVRSDGAPPNAPVAKPAPASTAAALETK